VRTSQRAHHVHQPRQAIAGISLHGSIVY
jgi:hypothetical protein